MAKKTVVKVAPKKGKIVTFEQVKDAIISDTKKVHAAELAKFIKAKTLKTLNTGEFFNFASSKTENLLYKFKEQEDSK